MGTMRWSSEAVGRARWGLALVMLGLAAGIPPHTVAGQATPSQLDSTRNNYVLPEGTETVPLGQLGQVVKRGSGPTPMILIPGHGFSAGVYDDFMAANAERYTMYAVTLAGFGGTPPPPLPSESSSYMDQIWTRAAERGIVELIRKEGLEQPVVVGHFLTGGQLALRVALDHSDMIRAAVVLAGEARREFGGGTPDGTDPRTYAVDEYLRKQWFKWVTPETWVRNNWRAPYFAREGAVAKELWEMSNSDPLPVLIQYLAEFFASDIPAEYERLRVPVLVLTPGFSPDFTADPANRSATVFFQDSWETARPLDGIQVDVVDGARLFLWKDEPSKTYAAIADFLTSTEASIEPGADP